MARLGPQKRRKLTRILRQNGLVEAPKRGKGSHTWWRHRDDATRATAVPYGDEIPEATARDIILQAGKTIEEYLSHLR